jgi:MFS family permease
MDVSSEMIHGLLPFFLVSVLKTSALTFGVIEGVAEASTAITKLFSGVVSDWWGKRKPLLLAGYGLAALVRPVFPLATTATAVFCARLIDRVGKGIRGAPRDALVADITPPDRRGAAYGLRQSMDSVGAFVGPLIALGLMLAFGNDVRVVFWIAAIPADIPCSRSRTQHEQPPQATSESASFAVERKAKKLPKIDVIGQSGLEAKAPTRRYGIPQGSTGRWNVKGQVMRQRTHLRRSLLECL